MKIPTIKIINATTGEEIERLMNEEEFAQYKLDMDEALAKQLQKEAEEKTRLSAIEKLAALGLDEDEVTALIGA